MNKTLEIRDKVLKILGGRVGGFYLAGGTALSLYYFKHRESFDLDFFTRDFSRPRIEALMLALSKDIGFDIELVGEQTKQGFARMMVYSLKIDVDYALKIDFVEDVYKLLEPLRIVDGIPVFSIQDIYFRKILTSCGSMGKLDSVGRMSFVGGRQEAKDFFDLFYLSNTFMPLSIFVQQYGQQSQKESIIVWFRTFDRFKIKSGLMEIITDKEIFFQEMESHFKAEVEKIIFGEI